MPAEDIDAGAAARAAAIRRSVVTEEEPPAPPEEDDLFDEDGAAPEPRNDFEDDFDDEAHADDFGVADAVKDATDDEFDFSGEDEEEDLDEEDLDEEDLGEDDDYDEEEYDQGDFVARRRAEQRRDAERAAQSRKRKFMVFGWASLVLFWLFILFASIFMRDSVVKTFPGLGDFYEWVDGIADADRFRPTDGELTTPLTEREIYVTAKLYNDRTRVETVDGRPVLMVRGFVENPSTEKFGRTASVPRVQVEVLDRQGRVLETVIADPPGFALRRGAKLDFETSVYPVPSGAANVSVKVLEGTRSKTVPSAS